MELRQLAESHEVATGKSQRMCMFLIAICFSDLNIRPDKHGKIDCGVFAPLFPIVVAVSDELNILAALCTADCEPVNTSRRNAALPSLFVYILQPILQEQNPVYSRTTPHIFYARQ